MGYTVEDEGSGIIRLQGTPRKSGVGKQVPPDGKLRRTGGDLPDHMEGTHT